MIVRARLLSVMIQDALWQAASRPDWLRSEMMFPYTAGSRISVPKNGCTGLAGYSSTTPLTATGLSMAAPKPARPV